MSFSVDDLASSFSSSHIGQEAIDLAALQAQLAEALLGGSAGPGHARGCHVSSGHKQYATQPCSTPAPRTPSLSSSLNNSWVTDASSKRGSYISSAYMDDMEEDERMVEELLIPASPTLGSVSGSHYGNPPATFSLTTAHNTDSNMYSVCERPSEPSPTSPSTSAFTSTDPFYLAQLQALANPTPQPQSIFAQNGRLAQNSPFALPQYHSFHAHGQNWEHSPVAIQTAAAF
ncbi:hypothetical protein CVT26_009109 [Gymnopilus dilepis]|uniref:Uncharacterized protein n=1 Tax=Gymnopilus dilepis TaxID=231916 RepID=A0A409Y9W3_9AGAR|nr:hypothetical protein CVT26_009109 [Gymnopilus dilepis]